MSTIVLGSYGWIGSKLVASNVDVAESPISSFTSMEEFKTWLPLQKVDTYINCVGRMHGSASEMEWANVGIVETLINHAKRSGSRILNLGSAAEYGNQQGDRLHEMQSCTPISTYGVQKLAARQLMDEFIESGGEGVHARLFNVVGSGQKSNSALGQISQNLLSLQPGSDYAVNDFDIERDYVALEFVCQSLHAISKGTFKGTINIGSGKSTKLFDVVEALASRLDIKAIQGSLDPSRLSSAVADTVILRGSGIVPEALHPKDIARMILPLGN